MGEARLTRELHVVKEGAGQHGATFEQRFVAANKLFSERKFEEADDAYRGLLVTNPRSAALLCKLGSTALRLGHEDEASSFFDRAEAIDRAFPWSYIGRADLLVQRGDLEAAVEELERAASVDPSLSFVPERAQRLRKRIEQAAGRVSEREFKARFTSANRLLAQQRFEEAEAEYRALLLDEPRSAPLLTKLASLLRKQGRAAEAEALFDRAVAVDPGFAWAHAGRAEVLEERGDFSGAIGALERALAIEPGMDFARTRIAALQGAGAHVAELPSPPSFKELFAAANKLFDDRRFADAEIAYLRLLDRDPDSAPLLTMLANIALQFGRNAQVLDYLERAERADPDYVWHHVCRAELLAAKSEVEAAIDTLEKAQARDPTQEVIGRRIASLRHQAFERARLLPIPEIRTWSPTIAREPPSGPRVAVVSWDLTHNPVGRAWMLADLLSRWADPELVGPLFPAYGDNLWAPLRESDRTVPVRGFSAHSFSSFVAGAIRLVAQSPCDVAWVSKPRLPSLLIGFLYKLIHGAAVICDVDDDELAFVGAERPLDIAEFLASVSHADWREPYGARWTQLAQSMLAFADATTVCNPVLQRKHGGFLIRHARDEALFNPARFDRREVRARYGFSDFDKVVLFLGTPRRHKGILALVEALRALKDPAVVLCIIGSIPDRSLGEELDRYDGIRIVRHPDIAFSKVPECNAMADVVCVLQDSDNAISHFQTPAKITDALAMGAPVIAFPTPPVADLVERGGIVATSPAELAESLRALLGRQAEGPQPARERRRFFLSELSYRANARRARGVVELALLKPKPPPEDFLRLLRHIDTAMPGGIVGEMADKLGNAVPPRPRAGLLRSIERDVNLVMFWKQNDTGLYGRRQEMLLDELSRSERIKRILHIDAPISADSLEKRVAAASHDEGRYVASQAIARHLGTQDEGHVHRRTFIYRGQTSSLMGRELPYKEGFPNAVEGWLRELGMLDNLIAWVCPVVPLFPEVNARIGFPFIVADVIDDQRQWPMAPAFRAELEANYRSTFDVADLAIANCEPVADWLRQEGLSPIVMPNGMEIHADVDAWAAPPGLAALPRPIVGYVGNLHDRIDWALIARIADARPDWTIVLIGSAPRHPDILAIASKPNVRLLGVVPYRQALRHIAAFDVAMIPHLRTDLSDRMNPLKLYVYRSLGVPVVSTRIANLSDLADDIRVSPSPEDFLRHLEDAIEDRRQYGRRYPDPVRMRAMSWESRLKAIFAHMDRVFEERRPSVPEKAG